MDAGAQFVGQGAGVAKQIGGGQRQPFDADVDLDPAVAQAVHLVVGFFDVLQRIQLCSGSATSLDSTARMPISSAARPSPPSWRYMSLTVVTPHLMDSR